jgi:manganese/iron transport system permease protein/iron/zinc/copper transport system permease protein
VSAVDLFEPYEFEFFRNALVVAVLAGAVCGLIGVYVVLRGMSYIGHGLSHAVFGGAAAAAVMGVNYFLGAGLWGVASGLLIGRVARRRIIGADAAIGVVTTASFALGIVLFNRYGQARKSLDASLFGSVLGVERADVVAVAVVGALVLGAILMRYRPLLFATFDPDVAQVSGVNVAHMEALLMIMLSLTILVAMRVVGVLLISALLVTPAITARMLTNSFGRMLWLSPVIGAVTAFVGTNVSYHADWSPGATVILCGSVLFAVVFIVTGVRGRRRTVGLHSHESPGLRAAA